MKYILWLLIIVLAAAVIATITARYLFERKVQAEVKELFKDVNAGRNEAVTREDLSGLPDVVQKWLGNSRIIGKEEIITVRLKQKGSMRIKPEQSWIPFEAEQYFNAESPGFIWSADVKAAPFIHIAGRDRYYNGKGNMLIKIMSLIKVADAAGMEIDQGALLRYLAEIIWFPTAALNDYIKWEGMDDTSAKATMTCQGVTASGIFVFDQQGNPVSFSAKRYWEQEGKYNLYDWYVQFSGYNEFHGIVIPVRGEVTWKLPEGDFNWFQFEVTEVEYNKPDVY